MQTHGEMTPHYHKINGQLALGRSLCSNGDEAALMRCPFKNVIPIFLISLRKKQGEMSLELKGKKFQSMERAGLFLK